MFCRYSAYSEVYILVLFQRRNSDHRILHSIVLKDYNDIVDIHHKLSSNRTLKIICFGYVTVDILLQTEQHS
jgi:hypothetical protein